jgi:hypothetical protein
MMLTILRCFICRPRSRRNPGWTLTLLAKWPYGISATVEMIRSVEKRRCFN